MRKNEFMWLAIIGCFGYYFYHLFDTEKIGLFLHPRMYKLGYFAFIVFCVFFIVQIKRMIFNRGDKRLQKGYIIFILPIVMVLIVQPKSLSTQLIAQSESDVLSQNTFASGDTVMAASVTSEEEINIDGKNQGQVCDCSFELTDGTENANKIVQEMQKSVDEATEGSSETEVADVERTKEEDNNEQQEIEEIIEEEQEEQESLIENVESEEIIEVNPATEQEMQNEQNSQNSLSDNSVADNEVETSVVVEEVAEVEDGVEVETEVQLQPTTSANFNDELVAKGITEESEQYFELLKASYEDLDSLVGKEVTITAFVTVVEDFDDNQFYAGRLIITCCAACAQVDGFICESDTDILVEDGEWITLTGVVELTEYYSKVCGETFTLPLIRLNNIERIEEPSQPYVYFVW